MCLRGVSLNILYKKHFVVVVLAILTIFLATYLIYQDKELKDTKPVTLTYQYFDGCPSADTLLSNIKLAIKGYEDAVELKIQTINTDELAKKYKFRGSPTLLINNMDFANMIEPINASLSCRVYANGVPTTEAIIDRINAIINYEK